MARIPTVISIGMELPATPVQGSVTNPPEGWTTDEEMLCREDARQMAERYGLRSPRAIMWADDSSCLLIFQSDNRFYIWNPIEDEVLEFQKLTSLGEFVAGMTRLGLDSLPAEQVFPLKRS